MGRRSAAFPQDDKWSGRQMLGLVGCRIGRPIDRRISAYRIGHRGVRRGRSKSFASVGLLLNALVNHRFTNSTFLKLAPRFENDVFCKPWVVKKKES